MAFLELLVSGKQRDEVPSCYEIKISFSYKKCLLWFVQQNVGEKEKAILSMFYNRWTSLLGFHEERHQEYSTPMDYKHSI